MTTTEDSSMTPTQAANFRILRRVIFGGGGDSCLPAVARDAPGWADQQHASRTIAVEAGRHRACGRSGALSVLAGLVFAWFASSNIAKILARHVE